MSRSESLSSEPEGVLLIGHGTRDPVGIAEFLQLAELVAAATGDRPLEASFLEFAQPTIEAGFERLVARGVKRIVAMPLLLFSAGHAKQDVPAELARLEAGNPGVVVYQAAHLGCHSELVRLSLERYEEALAGAAKPATANETLLLFVGRGSRDDNATREMLEFAELRRQSAPISRVAVAFASMARPSVDELLNGLDEASLAGIRRVVVQPHLLLSGLMHHGIRAKALQFAAEHPTLEVLVTEPLGVSPLVVQAIVERIAAANVEREIAR